MGIVGTRVHNNARSFMNKHSMSCFHCRWLLLFVMNTRKVRLEVRIISGLVERVRLRVAAYIHL